jgi:hypothetical protein
MYTQDQELELSRKFARFVLVVTLSFAGLFLVVGAAVTMLTS